MLLLEDNKKAEKLRIIHSGSFFIYDLDLSGVDYVWRIALETADDDIAGAAIDFLKDLHNSTNISPSILDSFSPTQFVDDCFLRLSQTGNLVLPQSAPWVCCVHLLRLNLIVTPLCFGPVKQTTCSKQNA